MKNIIKLSALALVATAFGFNASAQSSATASASANIVTPITITKNIDMDFGNAAVQASAGGTVVLAPAGTRSATSGVTLPAVTGTVTAAEFAVAGQANYTYAITLPTTLTISDAGNAHSMVINSFSSNPSATGTLDGSGAQTLTVGATLNVNAAQASGSYTSGSPFSVTVNYN